MDQLSDDESYAVFVSEGPYGLDGFLEVSIRPQAEKCHSGRVGYIEGWYVAPEAAGLESGDN